MIDLLDPAMIHDHDPVGGHHRFGLVMRHIDGGDVKCVMQAADFDRISSRRVASRLDSGSSSSSTSGRITMARARATRCCCPPRVRPDNGLQVAHMHDFQHLADPPLDSALAIFRNSSPNATFCSTVMFGQIA